VSNVGDLIAIRSCPIFSYIQSLATIFRLFKFGIPNAHAWFVGVAIPVGMASPDIQNNSKGENKMSTFKEIDCGHGFLVSVLCAILPWRRSPIV